MKTHKDLLKAALEQVGGPEMVVEFELLFGSKLKPKASEILSDEEYDKQLKELEKEIPAFKHHVMQKTPTPETTAKLIQLLGSCKNN